MIYGESNCCSTPIDVVYSCTAFEIKAGLLSLLRINGNPNVVKHLDNCNLIVGPF